MSAQGTAALVRRSVAVLVLVGAANQPSPVAADLTAPYVQAGSSPVAPGVVERWGSTASEIGPAIVKMAVIDPAQSGIHFRTSLPNDQVTTHETTTSQAMRYTGEGHRVVAAINGPISWTYPGTLFAAEGINVKDGELTSVNKRWDGSLPTFAVDANGRPRIGTPTVTATITLLGGAVASIDRINAGRRPGETVLYTPRFDTHTQTDATGDEYVIGGAALPLTLSGEWTGTVTQIRRGQGDSPIGAGQLVLSTSGVAAAQYAGLAVNDVVKIDIGADAGWADSIQAIGAKTLIVRGGAVDIAPLDSYDTDYAHPRMLVGITADGHVLMVVVEGRTETSTGLKIADAAKLMIQLGAVDAINMDGGGSTTLLVRELGDVDPHVVNQLAGGGGTPAGTERAVSNTLQVISTLPTGPLAGLVVKPGTASLVVGQKLTFAAPGYDRYDNGVAPGTVQWTTNGGTISAGGTLTPQVLGAHTLTAAAGGFSASAAVSVAPNPGPTVPTGLTATIAPGYVVKLAWKASSSVVPGQILYRVFRDGIAIGVRQTGLTYTDKTTAGLHQYQVRAIDPTGKLGALSAPLSVRAYLYPPPAAPTGLAATTATGGIVYLKWNAVTAYAPGTVLYRVYRDGTPIGLRQTALHYTDHTTIGTHVYRVRAIDGLGQLGPLSPPLTVSVH